MLSVSTVVRVLIADYRSQSDVSLLWLKGASCVFIVVYCGIVSSASWNLSVGYPPCLDGRSSRTVMPETAYSEAC